MDWLFYIRLFAFTAGSLVYLFLVVLLAGLRKPRLPESLLFFTGIGLFLFYAGGLLALNATIVYDTPPIRTVLFALTLTCVGLAILPPLGAHAPLEFLARAEGRPPRWARAGVALLYLPAAYFFFVFLGEIWTRTLFDALEAVMAPDWRSAYGIWLAAALFVSAGFELRLVRRADSELHTKLGRYLAAMAVAGGVLSLAVSLRGITGLVDEVFHGLLVLLVLLPVAAGAWLTYFLVKQSLRGTGIQRSLVYSVVLAFVALIYLTLARRLSMWLEPLGIPPEATVSILLFVFVLFLEPVQRRVARVLERAFRREAESLQHLTAEIQQVARVGEVDELLRFAEKRIAETLGLVGVRIVLRDVEPGFSPASLRDASEWAGASGEVHRIALRSGAAEIGMLEARYHGQVLSGETHAALEFLAEQLPAALDLCRLIHDKVRLERELAERQRLASLGLMAASISHNLKNPLSSMKTLLQLQIERSDLPEDVRRDTTRVLEEVDRLSAKLRQLLDFARPPVRDAHAPPVCVAAVARQSLGLLRHEAERRGVKLELAVEPPAEQAQIRGSEAALDEILSNLIVNALEAVSGGCSVRVQVACREGKLLLSLLDDGPGIPPEIRDRLFQPFVTSKPKGTGLGLAIIEKRVTELGGTIRWQSPVRDGRGTEFVAEFPLADAGKPEAAS